MIRFRAKTGHTFVKQVDFHGVYSIKQNINSEIKFQTIYQVRRVNVVLGNNMVMGVDVFPSSCQEYSFALGFTLWLYDEDFVLNLLFLLIKMWLRLFLFLRRRANWFWFCLYDFLLCLRRFISLRNILLFFLLSFFFNDHHWLRFWLRWLHCLLELILKDVHLIRQDVGRREKVVVIRKLFEHQH